MPHRTFQLRYTGDVSSHIYHILGPEGGIELPYPGLWGLADYQISPAYIFGVAGKDYKPYLKPLEPPAIFLVEVAGTAPAS